MKNTIYKTFSVHWLLCVLLVFTGISQSFSRKVEFQAPPGAPSGLTASTISSSSIQLTWTDNSTDETGFKVERSLSVDSGFESFALLPANATYLVNHELSAGTTYFYRVSAFNDTGDSVYSNVASSTTNSNASELPYYWSNIDIGSPRLDGSATFSNGVFETEGNGRMGQTANSFHFVYQSLQGDGEIIAQLTRMREAHWDHQGIMIKETLDPGSSYAMNELYRDKRILIFKGRKNGNFFSLEDSTRTHNTPIWLKMERSGNIFIASYSKDGKNWTETNRETIAMGANTFIGLVSHASSDDKISDATWRDVAVSQGSGTLAAPSNLEVESSQTDEAILSWDDNSDNETGFRIERAIEGDDFIFEDLAEVGPNVTSFQDDGLTLGGTFFYRVRAIDGNMASLPSNQEDVEIQKIQFTTLLLQRLAGDYDRTSQNNTINVNTTADTVENVLRHPGMIGKQIGVILEDPLSSLDGTISFKIMPNTHNQSVDFFRSQSLRITQARDKLLINANGEINIYDVMLDSITCNHIALRFNNGVMSPYVNGTWFDDVNVGTFSINSFALGEYNGNLWEVRFVNSQIDDAIINEISGGCTSEVEPSELPFSNSPFKHCGVYTCLWVQNESQLQQERKRAYLVAQDIAYDKNTFDVGMYLQPDLDAWVEQDRNVISSGFDYFKLDNIFTKEQGNTSYWLHENFHGYQVPLEKGGKWLAEASANWATWNYYKESLRSIGRYTLDPHRTIFESQVGSEFARFYHSSLLLSYITHFVSDEAFMGRLYNEPTVVGNAVLAISKLLAEEGHDFDKVFAEFAARTAVWDYPDPTISDDFAASEQSAINVGLEDNRLVDVMTEVGTFGVFQPAHEEFLPGGFYAWNTYKVSSTAASTYTLKLKGSTDNEQGTSFVGKVVVGVPGSYEYHNIPISSAVALGDGESQVQVEVAQGQELYLLVVTTTRVKLEDRINYSYAIGSSAHILPDDHIQTFVLGEEARRSIIDHENLTISAEVVRGTDPTSLSPTITLSEGATSDPAPGASVDFTEPVTYSVTGPGSTTAKEWTVSVAVVPPRTGTDFLTFELENLLRFSSIDTENHTVTANKVSDIDLTNVVPVFTLSDGATSIPASGETVDLSSPVTYIVTAEDGVTTQSWTVSAVDFKPFITTWETSTSNDDVSIQLDDEQNFDFRYEWKNEGGATIASGAHSIASDGTDFTTSFQNVGTYTLEIIGNFPSFSNYPREKLLDVNQWGNVEWLGFSFSNWDGSGFSASDVPDLSRVTSFFGMFRKTDFFNGDLSRWDVSNVTSMTDVFNGAKAFNSDLSDWDVSNVTNMSQMFRETRAFNADISRWDISSLLNMDRMFFSASAFDQSLGNWDVQNTPTMDLALRSSGLSRLNYDRTLIGWASQNVRPNIELGANGLNFCAGEEARNFLINEKKWTITDAGVDCPENGEANILFFELDAQLSPAVIDDENHTIFIEAFAGSSITALKPNLTLSKDATSVPASGTEVDFTEPVTYTVTALDGTTTQDWTVTVTAVEILLGSEEQESTMYIYPNPVKNLLHLETQKESTAWLVDMNGRQVVPSKSGRSLLFNLDKLENGLYILMIKFDGEIVTRKVLKTN
ncbi:BspA family leucine-rich repeat surface protein [Ekhidna sp.]